MSARHAIGIDATTDPPITVAVDIRTGQLRGPRDASNPIALGVATSDGAKLAVETGADLHRAYFVARHALVAGAGVASPSTLVVDASRTLLRCMLNSRVEAIAPAGVTGPMLGRILPGYLAYEFDVPVSEDMQQTAFALRSKCESFRAAGVPVRRFVVAGERSTDAVLMQTFADALDARVKIAASPQPVALGAAILACVAAGPEVTGFVNVSQLIHAMAPKPREPIYRPDLRARRRYDELYEAARADGSPP